VDNATVSGSIAITGWALDDGGLENVKIYLVQGKTQTYIGDAIFVEGARPDVAAAYPEYPSHTKAGWGYMMLTNFLPGGGNGTFVLSVVATDLADKTTELGKKTIIADNAHAVKPFGTIDTPTQGGMATGSRSVNWGWVMSQNELHQLPIGSTLDAKSGTFSWSPGPGFLGRYFLVFVLTDSNGQSFKKYIEIKIEPSNS
jgi:hypothetical protein